MASVTQRINAIKQPRGGYINPKSFSVRELNDDGLLLESENIHASLVGLAVDYLTRALISNNPLDAFKISILGARLINERDEAVNMARSITDLSEKSITAACKLVGYDVCFRAGIMHYRPVQNIWPDANTIKNVRTMVKRSLRFFKEYGPVTEEGFTFEGGYTEVVDAGDGDFITSDTLWDFKVSVSSPKKEHTLQLLMYYLMGIHSIYGYFHMIERLGIFNPRLNKVYLLDIVNISAEVIKTVEKEIICYDG